MLIPDYTAIVATENSLLSLLTTLYTSVKHLCYCFSSSRFNFLSYYDVRGGGGRGESKRKSLSQHNTRNGANSFSSFRLLSHLFFFYPTGFLSTLISDAQSLYFPGFYLLLLLFDYGWSTRWLGLERNAEWRRKQCGPIFRSTLSAEDVDDWFFSRFLMRRSNFYTRRSKARALDDFSFVAHFFFFFFGDGPENWSTIEIDDLVAL